MSTAKRLRERRADAAQAALTPPASKRLKHSHVPTKSTLDDLVDDDRRPGTTVQAKLTNGVSRPKSHHVDESGAALAQDAFSDDDDDDDESAVEINGKPQAPEYIDISSQEEDSSEYEEDQDEAPINGVSQIMPEQEQMVNGHTPETSHRHSGQTTTDAEIADVQDYEDNKAEPSFGDLLHAQHPEPIDVRTTSDAHSLVPISGNQIIPSGHSLGTLLSQALKNNDKDLLETCFAMTDHNSIRATIQRQKSQEVVVLLERIAERIHRRPGRTGPLLIWVQWSLVAHGGYLANQPELMKKLRSLSQVVRERASGLQPLLHLKGKLDLLSAQLEFRRELQEASRLVDTEHQDDPSGVLYVEGQDKDWSESEEETGASLRLKKHKVGRQQSANGETSEESGMENGVPNGVPYDTDAESSSDEEDEDEANGLLDVEADEGSEEDEEDSSGHERAESDVSSLEDDSSDDDDDSGVKRPKPSTLNRKR